MYLYRKMTGHPTPKGVFKIWYKSEHENGTNENRFHREKKRRSSARRIKPFKRCSFKGATMQSGADGGPVSAGGKETAPRRPLPVQAVRFGSGAMRQTGRHRHRRQQRRRNAADVQGAELGLISCSRAALGARHQPQNQHTVAENAEQVQLNPRGRQRAPLQQPCATGGSCKHGSGRSPALHSSIAQETLPSRRANF